LAIFRPIVWESAPPPASARRVHRENPAPATAAADAAETPASTATNGEAAGDQSGGNKVLAAVKTGIRRLSNKPGPVTNLSDPSSPSEVPGTASASVPPSLLPGMPPKPS
jgi:hypothetical protein